MQQWEYRTLISMRNDERMIDEVRYLGGERLELQPFPLIEAMLNTFGAEGWELVGFSSDDGRGSYVFKRPRADDQEP